jgi:putative redox protein
VRTVRVAWRPEEGRFTAEGTHAGHVLAINAPRPPEEPGPPTGFSPTELLLAGIGSCSAWDVVRIARKARIDIDAIDVTVTGEQAPDPPWRYERITVHFTVTGRGMRRSRVERAIRLSCDRYCSVLATVRGVAATVWTLELIDLIADGAPAAAPDRTEG